IAVVILAVAAAYLTAEHAFDAKLSRRWRELLAAVTGLLPLAGIAVLYDHSGAIVGLLIAATLINGELALRLRQSGLGMLAILSLLAIPYVFLRAYLDPALPWSSVSGLVLAEVPLLVWWSRRMRGWPESGTEVGLLGYLLALLMALVTAAYSSHTALLVVGLAVAGILYGLSVIEHRAEYVYGAAASLYLALVQLS